MNEFENRLNLMKMDEGMENSDEFFTGNPADFGNIGIR
jgi:hypothetical protein